jgi:transcriptional regulator with XRE-family HTH domain
MEANEPSSAERAPIDVLVANRLRSLRAEKGMTLQELAEKTGIAASFLSRVENHKASPPLAGLAKLAQALGVQVESLVQQDTTPQLIVMSRAGQRTSATSAARPGFNYQLLARPMRSKLMEPFLVQLKPGPRPKLGTHAGEEFFYVLKGEVTLFYGKDEMLLKAGDSVYYNATVPHVSVAAGRTPSEILVVISSRDYLYHGDLEGLIGKLRPTNP